MKLPLEHLVRYQNGAVRGANGEDIHRGIAAIGVFAGLVPAGGPLFRAIVVTVRKFPAKVAARRAAKRNAKIALQRPPIIPANWKASPSSDGTGMKYEHPTMGGFHHVRAVPGRPNHRYANCRRPYVRVVAHGYARDVQGNKVSKFTKEAYIPIEDFDFDTAFSKVSL